MTAPRLRCPQAMPELLLFKMWTVNAGAGRMINRMCEREFGVTRREWRVLAHLAVGEGVLSSELAERVGLDRARTSRAVSSLSDKRLIARTPRPGDRREIVLNLTADGRTLYAALFPRVVEINRGLLAGFSDDEVVQLSRLLDRLQVRAADMASTAEEPGAGESP